ncbi:MAG: type II toxin-antitoxin system HicB family antitoxin [Chloroflexi bacterium]|nr:type II toxin-antitoxin system HicB family antitoxin [Chloroflexota bacterium]
MNQALLACAEALAARTYNLQFIRDWDGGKPYFFVEVLEMPGCHSDGETIEEARENVQSALVDYIYFLLEDGMDIPEPQFGNRTAVINRCEPPKPIEVRIDAVIPAPA